VAVAGVQRANAMTASATGPGASIGCRCPAPAMSTRVTRSPSSCLSRRRSQRVPPPIWADVSSMPVRALAV